MDGTRLQKVARLIQKDLGEIFQREGAALFPGKMITITQVRVSPDLALAKVYVSIFPTPGSDTTLELIRHQVKTLRMELGKRVRHQLRIIPELAFFVDDSLDYIENIDRLLNQ
ncbi:MAG: 30S ribosome-binding factor RbfA [Bacteroidales bacterium]